MKLVRFGPVGQERPGSVGTLRQASGPVADPGRALEVGALRRSGLRSPASLVHRNARQDGLWSG